MIIDDIYIDQAMTNVTILDRNIFSAFTPHSIKLIDSEYCERIRNINNKVKRIYKVERVRDMTYYRGKLSEGLHFHDEYFETWLNHHKCGRVKIVWELPEGTEHSYEFHYYEPYKIRFNVKTRRESVKSLISSIRNNPHLHQVIKDNLLLNLKNKLNERNDFPLT